jgi:hypothetical protein
MIAQKYISRESYPLAEFQGSFHQASLQHSVPSGEKNLLETVAVVFSPAVYSPVILSGQYRGRSLLVPQNPSSPLQIHTWSQCDCTALPESEEGQQWN